MKNFSACTHLLISSTISNGEFEIDSLPSQRGEFEIDYFLEKLLEDSATFLQNIGLQITHLLTQLSS